MYTAGKLVLVVSSVVISTDGVISIPALSNDCRKTHQNWLWSTEKMFTIRKPRIHQCRLRSRRCRVRGMSRGRSVARDRKRCRPQVPVPHRRKRPGVQSGDWRILRLREGWPRNGDEPKLSQPSELLAKSSVAKSKKKKKRKRMVVNWNDPWDEFSYQFGCHHYYCCYSCCCYYCCCWGNCYISAYVPSYLYSTPFYSFLNISLDFSISPTYYQNLKHGNDCSIYLKNGMTRAVYFWIRIR